MAKESQERLLRGLLDVYFYPHSNILQNIDHGFRLCKHPIGRASDGTFQDRNFIFVRPIAIVEELELDRGLEQTIKILSLPTILTGLGPFGSKVLHYYEVADFNGAYSKLNKWHLEV